MKFTSFHIKRVATTSSLQNINWLSKKFLPGKKCLLSHSNNTLPIQCFLYFLEGQVHKDRNYD